MYTREGQRVLWRTRACVLGPYETFLKLWRILCELLWHDCTETARHTVTYAIVSTHLGTIRQCYDACYGPVGVVIYGADGDAMTCTAYTYRDGKGISVWCTLWQNHNKIWMVTGYRCCFVGRLPARACLNPKPLNPKPWNPKPLNP